MKFEVLELRQLLTVSGYIGTDNYIVLESTEPTEIIGLEFRSEDDKLALDAPFPFTFSLANTEDHVAVGNLRTPIVLDGTLQTFVRYEGNSPEAIEALYGDPQSRQFRIEIGASPRPEDESVFATIGPNNHLVLQSTEPREIVGLEFESADGQLSLDSPSPFTFPLLDEPDHIAIGSLGESVRLDGLLQTFVRYDGNNPAAIDAVYGDQNSRQWRFEVLGDRPELAARIDPEGRIILQGDNVAILGVDVQSRSGSLEYDEFFVDPPFSIRLTDTPEQIVLGNLGASQAVLVNGELPLPIIYDGRDHTQLTATWGKGEETVSLPISFRCGQDRITGDVNGDNEVTFADFLVLADNFGADTGLTFSDGDINCDHQVDFADFLGLADNFGA